MIFVNLVHLANMCKTFEDFFEMAYTWRKKWIDESSPEMKPIRQYYYYPVKVDEQDYIDTRNYGWLFKKYDTDCYLREITREVYDEELTGEVSISTSSYYDKYSEAIATKLGIEDDDSNKLKILEYISENLDVLVDALSDDDAFEICDLSEDDFYDKNHTEYTYEDYMADEYDRRRDDALAMGDPYP